MTIDFKKAPLGHFSQFEKNIKEIVPVATVDLNTVFNQITTSKMLKEKTAPIQKLSKIQRMDDQQQIRAMLENLGQISKEPLPPHVSSLINNHLSGSQLNDAVREAVKYLKATTLPSITPSGVFKQRKANQLLRHSLIMMTDIDNIESQQRLEQLFKEITNEHLALMAFRSPSGYGIKTAFLFPFHDLFFDDNLTRRTVINRHRAAYENLCLYIESEYRIKVDASTSDVSRACFLCHDSNAWINPALAEKGFTAFFDSVIASKQLTDEAADMYRIEQLLADEQNHLRTKALDARNIDAHNVNATYTSASHVQFQCTTSSRDLSDFESADYWVSQLEQSAVDITADYRNWIKIAYACASLGEDGRSLFHRVSCFYPAYSRRETDRVFNSALRSGSKSVTCASLIYEIKNNLNLL